MNYGCFPAGAVPLGSAQAIPIPNAAASVKSPAQRTIAPSAPLPKPEQK